jgi:SNF family Na+-dependent transporter
MDARKDKIGRIGCTDATSSGYVPKGILLTAAFFLMLGGARLQLVPAFLMLPTTWQSALPALFFVVSSLMYLLVAYSLYTKKKWSHKFTITICCLDALYGFIHVGFVVLALLNVMGYSARVMLVKDSVNVTNLIRTVLMVYVVFYLRKPDVKQWFVTDIEGQLETNREDS